MYVYMYVDIYIYMYVCLVICMSFGLTRSMDDASSHTAATKERPAGAQPQGGGVGEESAEATTRNPLLQAAPRLLWQCFK